MGGLERCYGDPPREAVVTLARPSLCILALEHSDVTFYSDSGSREWHPRRTVHIAPFIMSTCTPLLYELGQGHTSYADFKADAKGPLARPFFLPAARGRSGCILVCEYEK